MEECYFLVKWQAKAYNFTKSNTPPWVFFKFFKTGQKLQNRVTHHKWF